MKKKNLLTLGALCLSLGLVVSSCNQTTPGTPGEPGKPGEDGQPGKDGADGKTYKDVIVVNDNDIIGGTVTQDVYFVTEGAHDKVTFTFTPTNEADNVVIDFEINGQVVEDLDPSATSYTIEDADDYKGSIQVTGITFTSVDAYGPKLLEDHVKALNEDDKALTLEVLNPSTTEGADNTLIGAKNIKENSYSASATTAVQKAWEDANDDVLDAIKKAKTDHKDDVKAQIEAIKTAAQTGITAIDEAYTQAVKDAIVQAQQDLEDLSEELDREEYTEEDKTSQLSSFEAKINAATTIEDLGSVIDGGEILSTIGTDDAEANSFYTLKLKAYEEVDKALRDVADFTDSLEDEELVTKLQQYGVDTTKLPTSVAEEHYKIISAATEIKWVKDQTNGDHTDLGFAGAEAVRDSVTGIKETVVANIKEKYHKEINDSKALAGLDSTKTALLGVVDNAISNFVDADKDLTTLSLSQYVSSSVEKDWISENGVIKNENLNEIGLIGYVEFMLANPVNTAVNTAFLNERISNAKTAALASLKEAKDAIKDETYLALTSYSVDSSKKKWISSAFLTSSGEISKEIVNPFFTSVSSTPDTKTKLYSVGDVKPTNVVGLGTEELTQSAITAGISSQATLNLDDWYSVLSNVDMTTVSESTNNYGTLYIQDWATRHLNDFKKIYHEGLKVLKEGLDGTAVNGHLDHILEDASNVEKATGVYGELSRSGLPGSWTKGTTEWEKVNYDNGTKEGTTDKAQNKYDFVSVDAVVDEWKKINSKIDNENVKDEDITNASDLITYADGIVENASTLKSLNDGFKEWYKGEQGKTNTTYSGVIGRDSAYEGYFKTPSVTSSTSSLRKALEEEIEGVIKGEISSANVTSWVRNGNLNKLYEEDVASYLEVSKDLVTQRYQEEVSSIESTVGDPVEQSRTLTNIYNTFNSYAGHKLSLDPATKKYVVDDKGDITLYLCNTIKSVDTWRTDALYSLEHSENGVHVNLPDFVGQNYPGSAETVDHINNWGVEGHETNFSNPSSFKLTKENGVYVASGEVGVMTEAQGAAFGGASTDTTFALISYEGVKGATKRYGAWTDNVNAQVSDLGGAKTSCPKEGETQETVLGLNGTGTVSNKNRYYKVILTDDAGKVLAVYVFDFGVYTGWTE